ncbi:MAG: M67 family metallopeptidase [Succinivibrionaceae bacterium]
MAKVLLSNDWFQKIVDYSRKELPNEACGLVGGVIHEDGTKEIKKVYFLTNKDASNEHFTIDPKEQLQAILDMRANGLKQLGNWHSHPESPSRPSEEDKRLSFDVNASYLILSLMNDIPILNSFHVDKKNNVVEKEDLQIQIRN